MTVTDKTNYGVLGIVAIVAVVGLVLLFSEKLELKKESISSDNSEDITGSFTVASKQDCISSSTRPCYDKQTGKKQISIQPQGGEKAFEACLKNAVPNGNGELILGTSYCEQEKFSYCYDGKSNVMLRKFEGKCDSGPIPTRNEACPDYQPVPYHQIYSSLEPNLNDLNTEYQSDYQSFLKTTRNERVYRLMQSSSGILFALVSRYEYIDNLYWYFVPYVYKSTDKGKTWTAVALPTTSWYQTFYEYTSGIAEDSNGNLYAGGYRGLWKSPDSGNSWNQIPIPTYDEFYRDLKPYAIRHIMALKDGSLVVNVEFIGTAPFNTYKSFDGGNTWNKLFAIPVYSMVEADDGSLVVSDYFGDVYKFSNNVLTKTLSTFWAGTEHPLLKARDGTIYTVTSENAHYTQSFKYLWGYPIVSYKSEDNGNTWSRMSEVPDALYGGRLLEGADGSIYVGTLSRCWGGTVYKLNANSKKWEVVSGSIPFLSNMGGPLYTIYSIAEVDGKILNAGSLGVIFNSP